MAEDNCTEFKVITLIPTLSCFSYYCRCIFYCIGLTIHVTTYGILLEFKGLSDSFGLNNLILQSERNIRNCGIYFSWIYIVFVKILSSSTTACLTECH